MSSPEKVAIAILLAYLAYVVFIHYIVSGKPSL